MTTTTEPSTEHEVQPVQAPAGEPAPQVPAVEPEQPDPEQAETFPRAYVEQLRQESAGHRVRAQQADTLAQRLHLALVTATGRLADPTDLAYDEAHLAGADSVTAAVDELLGRKPHLASRRPRGDVDQGARTSTADVDLAGMLRARAT